MNERNLTLEGEDVLFLCFIVSYFLIEYLTDVKKLVDTYSRGQKFATDIPACRKNRSLKFVLRVGISMANFCLQLYNMQMLFIIMVVVTYDNLRRNSIGETVRRQKFHSPNFKVLCLRQRCLFCRIRLSVYQIDVGFCQIDKRVCGFYRIDRKNFFVG